MKPSLIPTLIPGLAALLGIVLLTHWLGGVRFPRVEKRVPGADLLGSLPGMKPADLKGTFTKLGGVPAQIPGDWPGFRGVNHDNICVDPTPLARSWDSGGPKALWTAEMGEGYAGAAVRKGCAYVLDYDQAQRMDVIRCLSLADGHDCWRRAYSVSVKRNHGMSRTVMAVNDKYAVSLGPKCHVVCVDADSGDFRWALDLPRSYHTKVPPWYAGQCPLIDGDRLVLAPGGEKMMIATDLATGKVRWETPNPHGWAMSHSSIIPTTFHGKRMYLYCASGGVVGVDAENGAILWETDAWKISIATVPTPVLLPDGRIFLTGGYNSGSMLLQLTEQGGKFGVKVLWHVKPDVFGSDQQTPIYYQSYLYGVIPGGQLVCLDAEGKQVWNSGAARFGLGPYIIAQGMIYLVNDTGTLTLAEATPAGYHQLAQAKVMKGHDAWGPLALVNGRLIARDLTSMVCLDVRK